MVVLVPRFSSIANKQIYAKVKQTIAKYMFVL